MSRRVSAQGKAVAFFRKHAGYGYDPAKETEAQGRTRTARALAAAEKEAQERGWEVRWSHDDLPWDPGDTDYTPEEVLAAVLYDEHGNVIGSLSGIADPSKAYARVVEAELALEALHERGWQLTLPHVRRHV